jgi:hypothetical protein
MHARGGSSFLRKLAAAVPANLAVCWLVLDGSMPAVLILSAIGAPLGACLLMALESPLVIGDVRRSPRKGRPPATVHEFPRQPRPA